jgi:hypothetical protein
MGNQTRDLPACSIVPQPTTLPRVPNLEKVEGKYLEKTEVIKKRLRKDIERRWR